MQGDPTHSGAVLAGTDPVAVDAVAARVMGFDWRKIPMIREAFNLKDFPITTLTPSAIQLVSDVPEWNGRFADVEGRQFLKFRPNLGWHEHIEYEAPR